ncbi:MAG: cytochrome P450 [Dehalococcoidia bacterium]|nr:cytochrome P450 [Dehalococcoidia bacterium]
MATGTKIYPPRPVVDRRDLPPGPSELPVIGQSLRYLRDPIRFMQEAATYGDLVTMSLKPALLLLVNHPDLIRDIVVTHHQLVGRGPNADVLKYAMGDGLVTAGAEDHLQQRRLMQPQFHRGRIAGYGAVMHEYATHHQLSWADGQRVDMAREMGGLTLRIVVKTLFGLELPDDVRRIGEAFEFINNYLVTRVNQPPRLRRLLHRLPMPYTMRFRRARAGLDGIIFSSIAQRRLTEARNDDLLSLLLEALLEDADGNGKPLTDQQVRDQTITMFAAGHETTAVCLTWTWYLLALNPDIQSRFHAELDQVIGDRAPTLADLPNLELTDRILADRFGSGQEWRSSPSTWAAMVFPRALCWPRRN